MQADEWDATPFAPVIGQHPTRITFDHYLAWCPEAKFEWIDGQTVIGDWRGTRNVLGLLLMTFGLDAAVSLLHPRTGLPDCLPKKQRADTMPDDVITGGRWHGRPQTFSAKR
jgi:hypothetical protein